MVLLAQMRENTDVLDTLWQRSSAGTKRYQKNPKLYYTGWRFAVSISSDKVFSLLHCRIVMTAFSVLGLC